jgi:hypothetical protein
MDALTEGTGRNKCSRAKNARSLYHPFRVWNRIRGRVTNAHPTFPHGHEPKASAARTALVPSATSLLQWTMPT